MTPPSDELVRQNGLVIRTHDLSKRFGDDLVVNEVTMSIPRGSIFGFIGPSGCGKTTTMRLLLGIYEASSGVVEVLGRTPGRFTTADRQRIGYMPQLFVMYPDLTVREELRVNVGIDPVREQDGRSVFSGLRNVMHSGVG